jgi:LacI family transcriptional regulator
VIVVTSELTVTEVSALSRAHLPLVVVDPNLLPRARLTSVGATNFTGGLAATQHLIGLGHQRIAYVGGPARTSSNQARVHGFRGAMEAAGLPVPDEYVQYRQFHYDEGVDGGALLLGLPEPPTAVFAANDEIALGIIEAARVRGVRVPEDLSVVGFDDTQLAALASPPLTTVRQPLREMGAVALRRALRLAAGEEIESHHIELATELVVRGSTAPPAAVVSARLPGDRSRATGGLQSV